MNTRRLVLFDIDGTLLSGAGAGRRAVERALTDLALPAAHAAGWAFGGKTDPQIAREVLLAAGCPEAAIETRLPDFLERYLHHLRDEFPRTDTKHLKPGVLPLLDRLAGTPGVTVGLLTGNLKPGAQLKLEAFGLWGRFRVGAYGSDHAVRAELPPIAVARAERLTGHRHAGKEIVIIGDTEHDIRCGAALGVRAIAVCTGGFDAAALAPHGPDHLFADLADTDAVLAAILGDGA